MPYWRLSSFYFSYFFAVGVWMPFCALYFSDKGFSTADIGVLVAMISVTRIVAPNLWGWLADKTQRRMAIVKLGLCMAFLIFSTIYLTNSLAGVMLVVMGYTFFLNAVMSQFDVLTLRFLGDQHAKYGAIRLWGSLGFIAAVLIAGALFEVISIRHLPLVVLAGLLMAAIIPWRLKEPLEPANNDTPFSSRVFFQTLRQPATIAFLGAAFLLQISHAPYYTFFSIYLENNGYSRLQIGWLWAIAVIAEVAMFTQTHQLLKRYSVRFLMLFALWVAAIRWSGTALMADQLWGLLLMQLLHGFTFAVFHAASVDFVRQHFSPRSQGQAQSLLNATSFGAGAALGAFGSGLLWEGWGMLTYYLAAAAAAAGALAIWHYVRPSEKRLTHEKNETNL